MALIYYGKLNNAECRISQVEVMAKTSSFAGKYMNISCISVVHDKYPRLDRKKCGYSFL
jgi:hypothetical protein